MLLFETVINLIFWIVTRVSTHDYTVCKSFKLWIKIKQIYTPRVGNLGNVLLTNRISPKYFWQCRHKNCHNMMEMILFYITILKTYRGLWGNTFSLILKARKSKHSIPKMPNTSKRMKKLAEIGFSDGCSRFWIPMDEV